jgi:hypothetical protein
VNMDRKRKLDARIRRQEALAKIGTEPRTPHAVESTNSGTAGKAGTVKTGAHEADGKGRTR